ncbi:hypothetical protein [Flavobacterium sp.]|uniref:hypothetical protein n=1 Tax=Flavobacterium sp. TaxID=239 RepID=UPI003750CF34
MKDFLVSFGGFVAFVSFIVFIVGFFMIFAESKRKLGLKLMLFSAIAFVIGFGTCAANFSI